MEELGSKGILITGPFAYERLYPRPTNRVTIMCPSRLEVYLSVTGRSEYLGCASVYQLAAWISLAHLPVHPPMLSVRQETPVSIKPPTVHPLTVTHFSSDDRITTSSSLPLASNQATPGLNCVYL
ncbi:hypothetical protein CRENBAI_018207 [Crenichthys baileyi]|uniref:Uncharacterized protein n=1 Tax=Crenichthys baileyi TaxID=28760 RepID=A0AAV9SI37_9TELE